MLDETEVQTIPDARTVEVLPDGEIVGNPDPITDEAWSIWQTLLRRAQAVKVPSVEGNRASMTKSELPIAYNDLTAIVKDAERQAKSGEESQE
jgi:hypothetical protein